MSTRVDSLHYVHKMALYGGPEGVIELLAIDAFEGRRSATFARRAEAQGSRIEYFYLEIFAYGESMGEPWQGVRLYAVKPWRNVDALRRMRGRRQWGLRSLGERDGVADVELARDRARAGPPLFGLNPLVADAAKWWARGPDGSCFPVHITISSDDAQVAALVVLDSPNAALSTAFSYEIRANDAIPERPAQNGTVMDVELHRRGRAHPAAEQSPVSRILIGTRDAVLAEGDVDDALGSHIDEPGGSDQ